MALSLRQQAKRRSERTRRRLKAVANGRLRLSVSRSDKNISAQIIDDASGRTLASASTMDKQFRDAVGFGGNKDAATAIGKTVAERALAAGVKKICFDRGEFRYHGRVAALADAAREAGLEF